MAMRITSLNSGLDTESIIKEMVQAKQVKVDKLKKAQTKLEWKQDIWKSLNTKIFSFHRNILSDLKYQGSYSKKMTTISDSNIATVLTAENAMNSVQSLRVTEIAQSGYLTGSEISKSDGSNIDVDTKLTELGIKIGSSFEIKIGDNKSTEITVDKDTTIKRLVSDLRDAGVSANFDTKTNRFYIGAKETGEKSDFQLIGASANGFDALTKLGIFSYDSNTKATYEEYKKKAAENATKIADLESQIASKEVAMVDAKDAYLAIYGSEPVYGNFDKLVKNEDGVLDTLNDRIKELEEKESLTTDETNELLRLTDIKSYVDGYKTDKTELDKMNKDLDNENILKDKISFSESILNDWENKAKNAKSVKNNGIDSEIFLNGISYTSKNNTFEINGLTITCINKTEGDSTVTLNTQNDTSGIYDMIKKFVTGYTSLINEMDKLYNADLAKGLEPLTEEEKDSISEKEAEKLEDKVKASILRRDDNIGAVSSAMKEIMASGFSVNGKTLYLSDFGIETLGYFEAEINEKSAYHIHGDADDERVSNKENKLQAMISADPDTVMRFFNGLSNKLYNKITEMGSTIEGFRSSFTLYDDKKMKSDYSDYTAKIKDAEKKLIAYEDKWYQKFSAMEVALAKMQSNASAITGLLGGS